MKKIVLIVFMIGLLLLMPVTITAITRSEARNAWRDAKEASLESRAAHREAREAHQAGPNDETEQNMIDTGKYSLNAGLDEAEAWLNWKNIEAQENQKVPDHIKDNIADDVADNLETIEELRDDVESIRSRQQLGVVFLDMIVEYRSLLTDVARNTGDMWVYLANEQVTKMEEYEQTLRDSTSDEEIIAILNEVKDELEEAGEELANAEAKYEEVVIPGAPLIKFHEGNQYMRLARVNLLNAHEKLIEAFEEIAE